MKKIFLLFPMLIVGCSQSIGVSVSQEKDASPDVSVVQTEQQPYNFNYCSSLCIKHIVRDNRTDAAISNSQLQCLRKCLGTD